MKTTAPAQGRGGGGPLCGARLRQSEGTCRKTAGWGTGHVGTGCCRLHGGNTRNQVVGAQRAQLVQQAGDAVRRLGFEPVENPFVALQWIAGEVTAVKDYLRGEVERLDSLRYQGASGEQVRGELSAYQASLRDTVNVLGLMARLDIDAHLTRIESGKAQILVDAVVGGMAEVGITGELALRLRGAVADRLQPVTEQPGSGS
jgi:peptidyl-tRNA hydrolase